MSELLKRLAYLVSGWTCVGLVYCGSLLLQGKPTLINYSQIDLLIPFNYHVVWIYLFFCDYSIWLFLCALYKSSLDVF